MKKLSIAKTAFALSLIATPALAQGQTDNTIDTATDEIINSIQLKGSCVAFPAACDRDVIKAMLEATGCSINDAKAHVEDPNGTPAPKGCDAFTKRQTYN